MDQTFDNDRIVKINIEEEMKSSYIDYSMSVIVARALPDVRDGFNKSHHRAVQKFRRNLKARIFFKSLST